MWNWLRPYAATPLVEAGKLQSTKIDALSDYQKNRV